MSKIKEKSTHKNIKDRGVQIRYYTQSENVVYSNDKRNHNGSSYKKKGKVYDCINIQKASLWLHGITFKFQKSGFIIQHIKALLLST